MNTNTSKLLAAMCRWTARLLGTLLVVVLVAFAVGEGMPNPFSQPVPVQLGFLGLAILMVGLLAGWRWDLPAALISLTGWGLFVGAVMRRGPNWFVLALTLPAFLFLGSALFRRHGEQQATPTAAP